MKKLFIIISILSFISPAFAQTASIPPSAQKIIDCYKGYITGYASNYIIFNDGSKLIWDDGIKNKSALELLEHPDLKDMFSQKYPKGVSAIPPVNFDPGRVRDETF